MITPEALAAISSAAAHLEGARSALLPIASAENQSVVPHDTNAEEWLLGAMLLSRVAIDDVAPLGLEPGHFYRPFSRKLATAILNLHASGHPVDTVTVAAELDLMGVPDSAADLLDLQAKTPRISEAVRHAHHLMGLARLRDLISLCNAVVRLAYRSAGERTT